MKNYLLICRLTILVAFVVIGMGAYVRLSDAGLGCPDWPGCYGHYIGVPSTGEEIAQSKELFPLTDFDVAKAWKEMIHRYIASGLGLFIIFLLFFSYRYRIAQKLSWFLLLIVIAQGLLGMLTVTKLLKPLIVSSHLLGGLMTLSLLVAIYRIIKKKVTNDYYQVIITPILEKKIKILASIFLIAVVSQIALGGWVSSNYAALACSGFPTCNGVWLPETDFASAFTLNRQLGMTENQEYLSNYALVAIQLTHRIGAVLILILSGFLIYNLLKVRQLYRLSIYLLLAVILQWTLGLANIFMSVPIYIAVMHNLGAALLLSISLLINLQIRNN